MKPGLEPERRGLKWVDRSRLRWRLEHGKLADDPWEDDLRPCQCHRGWEQPWGDAWDEPWDEAEDRQEAEVETSKSGAEATIAGTVRHLRSVGEDR